MKEWFDKKSIAVIGNAMSLFDNSYGSLIDSHDIVCRINLGITVDSIKTHGEKTDVFVFSRFSFVKGHNLFNHPNLKTNKFFHTAERGREIIREEVSYYPLDMIFSLKEKLNLSKKQKPSTGIMLLDFLSNSNPKNVSIFGFDWKQTPTFYDLNRVDEPHVYDKEKEYCLNNFVEKLGYKHYK